MSAKDRMWQMQLDRFEIFKAQNRENDHFDVTFEVDKKLIYANKYVLETISTTFKSMLSERWKSKDDIIKLETYSYYNFYCYLTFIYSGDCNLTDENIFSMVDMAEFYGVTTFKNFCDEYISKMKINMDNVFEFIDLATKYSLSKTKESIGQFVSSNISSILQSDQFINLKKLTLEPFVTFQRGPGHEEKLFDVVYKWAENQLIPDESPAKRKRVNKNDAIKEELSGILPHIKFDQMNPGYFSKFVVPTGFFSLEEVSRMLCEFHKIDVTVTDINNRKYLTGSFVDTCNIWDVFNKAHTGSHKWGNFRWSSSFRPSIPSDLKKNENVPYYFVLGENFFQFKKPAAITENDFLICEMKGNPDFVVDGYCRINVIRSS